MSKTPIPIEDLLVVCAEAAKVAGNYARQNESRRTEVVAAGRHDVKLTLDIECQRKAEEVIRAHWGNHAVLGEEGHIEGDAGQPVWVIDPIDGTVNFAHGLPLWCSAVAVQIGGYTVAGAVYLPVLEELFVAQTGKHALLNGRPIHVSGVRELENALVFTGLSKHLGEENETLKIFEAVSTRVQKTRLMGAAAVDICNVACGRGDGYFESSIHLWDVAAAGLILQQAGGRVEVLEQLERYRFRYLGSNGLIHDELKQVVENRRNRREFAS